MNDRNARRPLAAVTLFSVGLVAGMCSTAADATTYDLPQLSNSVKAEHHPGKIIWADLVTVDLAGAEQFYSGLFGWTFKNVHDADKDYAIAYAGERSIAGLLQRALPAGEQRQAGWLTFIAVRDVDKALSLALRNGAKSVSTPRTYAGRGRQAVLTDPEGAVFAILASQHGDPADDLAEPGEWIWSSLHEKDPDTAAAFYQKVFNYEVFDTAEDLSPGHLILSTSDFARASVNPLPTEGHRHAHWLDFIRVNDATAAAAKAVSLGGKVLVEPRVDRHGGKVAVIADPYGAPLGLMEWAQDATAEGVK